MTPDAKRWSIWRGSVLADLPLDPDVDPTEDARHRTHPPSPETVSSHWPRVHWRIVAAVGIGGFVGGIARYGIGVGWPSGGAAFPWPTFVVNTSGAFLLGVLLIVVLHVLPPTTYLRPALGTGVCGAYTTFSSVATAVDQLVAHGHAGVAAAYVAASVVAGLAAALFGITLAQFVATHRAHRREG